MRTGVPNNNTRSQAGETADTPHATHIHHAPLSHPQHLRAAVVNACVCAQICSVCVCACGVCVCARVRVCVCWNNVLPDERDLNAYT